MENRSKAILGMEDSAFARSLFKSMGYTDSELKEGKPLIGIANTWNTLVPGHYNLDKVAEYVKNGIYAAGGTAVEFGTIAACDGVAQGHEGMHYILPSREIICDSVEIMAQAHRLDGLVLLASCGPNKHVNAWDRQSSALDPVGITSKKMAAKNKAEQAFYKPGEAVTFKKDRMMVFEQNPESNFSTSGTVRGGVKTGKVLVCGDLFAKVEFEDGSQGYVSLSEIVNPQEMMGFYPVSASDLIGPDGALLPLPSNMGAVSPEAAAASRELDISRMNTSLVPVPNSVSPSGAASQEAPLENVPLPESSVKQ